VGAATLARAAIAHQQVKEGPADQFVHNYRHDAALTRPIYWSKKETF